MDPYLGLFLVVILLAISIYTLTKETTIWNLVGTFLLLCFISYFTIYIIDTDYTTSN